jgi:hypothetical protein
MSVLLPVRGALSRVRGKQRYRSRPLPRRLVSALGDHAAAVGAPYRFWANPITRGGDTASYRPEPSGNAVE